MLFFEHIQVSRHDGILCLELNGGWNYPAVNYIWKRIYTELQDTADPEREQSTLVRVLLAQV